MMKLLSHRISVPMIDIRREEKATNAGRWIVRNFTSLPHEAACVNVRLGPNYLNNLERLGVIELRENYKLRSDDGGDPYSALENFSEIAVQIEAIDSNETLKAKVGYGAVQLTSLGVQFCNACIADGTHTR